MSEKTGGAVLAQARDNSFWNTEPAVAKGAAVGAATSITIALAAFGLITEDQRGEIVDAVGDVAFGAFVILPVAIGLVQALWTRLSTFSPRTAAKIAIQNAALPSGAAPTLVPPP